MNFPKLENGMITGRLTQEERTLVAETLAAKGAPKACELCAETNWALGDHIVSFQGLARHPTHFMNALADPFFPSILLMCNNCGNTKSINLAILGLGETLFPKAPGHSE
jgi:hypothetical protein